ncbi:MAG: biopolymer transporter ExbD [Pseudomonadota bacterium]
MKSSARARRMARSHRRFGQQARLSLVSLMDIFTILVFFLMVNSGDVEVLEADPGITLPESVSEQKPEIALTIKISAEDIVVQGRPLAQVETVLAQNGDVIAPLKTELDYQAQRSEGQAEASIERALPVIIMADQGMPYRLLKRVMRTCADSNYRDITLAVNAQSATAPAETLALVGG